MNLGTWFGMITSQHCFTDVPEVFGSCIVSMQQHCQSAAFNARKFHGGVVYIHSSRLYIAKAWIWCLVISMSALTLAF
jgi:hypothetical protein